MVKFIRKIVSDRSFLDQRPADGRYFFWPDLAMPHYAKVTVTLVEEENATYIPKSCSSPNGRQ